VSSAEFLGELQKKIRIAYLLPFSKKQFGKSFGNGGQAFRTKGCVTLWVLPFTLQKYIKGKRRRIMETQIIFHHAKKIIIFQKKSSK
jgi:hypothetical protein